MKYPPHKENRHMRGHAPLSHITGVPGWLSYDELDALDKYAKMVTPGQPLIEIGSEMGGSASVLRNAAPKKSLLVCIDINPDIPAPDNLEAAGFSDGVVFKFWNTQEKDFTDLSRHMLFDEPLGLLFLDGNHFEDAVFSDLRNWGAYVASGGYLILHDIAIVTNQTPHEQHYQVRRALDRFRCMYPPDEWRDVHMANRLLVMQRKPLDKLNAGCTMVTD